MEAAMAASGWSRARAQKRYELGGGSEDDNAGVSGGRPSEWDYFVWGPLLGSRV